MPEPLTQPAGCPESAVLLQLVSGSVNEVDADVLFRHVDQCEACQQRLDDLERRLERLPDRPVDPGNGPATSRLDRLMSQARRLPSSSAEDSTARETVSVDRFVSGLRRCGLFDELAISELLSTVANTSSSSMARELVSSGQLTPFQARVLLKGRWKGLVLGNYEILEKLGQGGMGSVFKARHRRLGRVVCVKVVNSAGRRSPKMLERFRNEARTVAALSHPNFVVAHDADEAEGVPFLVMEYVEGIDLSKQVERTGPLPLYEALTVIEQTAVAMQYAHDQGVTHRDIKPHNLLLADDAETGERQIKILDLGLARFDTLLGEAMDASQQVAATNTGVIMGTVDYMSPEQALRSRDADNRSDIYSLGCTMHFLLTGLPVFPGDTMMARLVAHREADVPSIERQCPGAPPGLDAIFRRMLAKDPADRYQSMMEAADDLQRLIAGDVPRAASGATEPTRVSALMQRRRMRSSRSRAAAVLLAVVVFLAVTAGGLAWRFKPQDTDSPASRGPADIVAATSWPSNGIPVWDAQTSAEVGELMARPAVTALIGDPQNIHFGEYPTLEHQGPAEAVLVLPQTKFNDRHFTKLTDALSAADVHVRVVAPQMNPLVPEFDQELQVYPDTTISELQSVDFDLLFIVDGSVQDFQKEAIRHDLSTVLSSASGMQRVIGATSDRAFDVLTASGTVPSETTPQKMDDVLFGRLSVSGGPVAWTADAAAIPAMVNRALSMRLAAVRPGLHRSTLAAYGNGRALIVLPMQGFGSSDYRHLSQALTEQGVEQVVTSTAAAQEAVSKDGRLKVPVKLSLNEVSANLEALTQNMPFHFLYDYVFVVGTATDQSSSKQVPLYESKDDVGRILQLAVNGHATVVGVSKHSPSLLSYCEELRRLQLSTKQDCYLEHAGSGAIIAVKTRVENLQQMKDFCWKLQERRRSDILAQPLPL
ncbi:MAG: hypothetical protein Fues2KO_09790 [Fuerstiella sp.]